MFEKEYTVRYSEIGKNGCATLSAVVAYLQDTTMMHSESLGQGMRDIEHLGLVWLLGSWHIQVDRYPDYSEKILVRTWATKFVGVYGYRDFEIVDSVGDVIVKASSIMILFDADEQKMKRVPSEMAESYLPEERYVFGEENSRLRAPKDYTEIGEHTVEKRDIDTNNHVNNIHYIEYAQEFASEDVSKMKISYKRAAKLGDTIKIGLNQDDGHSTYVMHDDNGSVYVTVWFE